MNFLIITDSQNLFKETSEQILKLESSAKIFEGDFSDSKLKTIKKNLDMISLCILYAETTQEFKLDEITRLCTLTGFLIANHISIVTNMHFISDYNFLSQDSVKFVCDKKDLSKYIKSQYKHISSDDKLRSAKKMLLDKGIPFTPDCFALYISKNKPEIFDLFIDAGMDVNARDDSGTPMLNIAVRNDNEDFTKRMLEKGADINAVSEDRGYTPVMDSVWRGNVELTKLLISKGANLNTISKEGQNNLVLAVGADKDKIVKLLAENGADPDVPDMMGMSAYEYATLFKKEKIVEILRPYHKAYLI